MIAVFERLDLETLRTILATASGDSDMELIQFGLQPTSKQGPSVPDASISGSFHYLFETKTAYNAIRKETQVRNHLRHFASRRGVDERLFVVTPDLSRPPTLARIKDKRVRWFNFKMLDDAILDVLRDEEAPEEERLVLRADERVLLRELHALLIEEGLLGRHEAVIVAAGWAYGFYADTAAYICQSNRFRRGLTHMGFYRHKRVEPHVAHIQYQEAEVPFTRAEALRRKRSRAPEQRRVAELIERGLEEGTHVDGAVHQVFLLSPIGSPDTDVLEQPIVHDRHGPWLRGHRYVYLDDLRKARTTDDL